MPAGFRGSRPEAQREHAVASDIPPTAQEVLSREFISFLGMIVAAGVNLRDLLKRTLGTVVQAASADSGSIILLDERGTPREACLAYNGEIWHQNSPHVANLATNGLAGWVLKNRKAAIVPSTLDDPRWLRSVWEKETDDSRSALVVPLLAGERPVGVLTLIRSHLRKFEESDLSRVRDNLAYA